MEAKEKKVEAIYPLTTIQQGLLFHHLAQKEDKGLLHVQCYLEGNLKLDVLKKSWDQITLRHSVLRTSVHWEKVKNPVQVIRYSKDTEWAEYDFSSSNKETQLKLIEQVKIDDRAIGVDFTKNPSSKVSLIKIAPQTYLLLWKCHHLLLDGWSASIILKDVFHFYEAICLNTTPSLEDVPSHKSYSNWLATKSKQDAAIYWQETFKLFSSPTLFNENHNKTGDFNTLNLKFSDADYEKIKDLAKTYRVTLNTFFQGIWMIVLAKYFGVLDVTFGNTVSGRSGSFSRIELMAGMFANTLPVRGLLDSNSKIKEWLTHFQLKQQKSRVFEDSSLEEINEWIANSSVETLFDSLFVFENFPWKPITSAGIEVKDFESGITTNYPMNFIVRIIDNLEVDILTDSNIISETTASWFIKNIKMASDTMLTNPESTIETVLEALENPLKENKTIQKSIKTDKQTYVAPSDATELELMRIWESLFHINLISIHDNFFELGGKSLMAVKMFAHIEQRLNIKLSPVTLLENPTVHLLAKIINSDNPVKKWKSLVPVRAKTKGKPLFCIHGGGGHVFFFNPLANAIDKRIPVYALQPSGIESEDELHESINEMARAYVDEIMQVEAQGPYNILVYCFSTAVGIEMARYFKTLGEETNLIVVDGLPEQNNFSDKSRIKLRLQGFIKRILKNPFSAISMMIGNNTAKFLKPLWIRFFGSQQQKDLEKVQASLVKIYNEYSWNNKHDANISLLLTEKHPIINKKYIESWEQLSNQPVKAIPINGKHHQLFEDEYATGIAEVIDTIILKKDN